jgi:leader peptidase (prepilin peptidase)/N-methyltransferase
VSLPMVLINLIKPTSFGWGDVLLMGAAGFLLGWKNTLLAMFFALILGGGYGVYLLAGRIKSGKDHFAFGPALSAGILLALFFGNSIILWYLSLFML